MNIPIGNIPTRRDNTEGYNAYTAETNTLELSEADVPILKREDFADAVLPFVSPQVEAKFIDLANKTGLIAGQDYQIVPDRDGASIFLKPTAAKMAATEMKEELQHLIDDDMISPGQADYLQNKAAAGLPNLISIEESYPEFDTARLSKLMETIEGHALALDPKEHTIRVSYHERVHSVDYGVKHDGLVNFVEELARHLQRNRENPAAQAEIFQLLNLVRTLGEVNSSLAEFWGSMYLDEENFLPPSPNYLSTKLIHLALSLRDTFKKDELKQTLTQLLNGKKIKLGDHWACELILLFGEDILDLKVTEESIQVLNPAILTSEGGTVDSAIKTIVEKLEQALQNPDSIMEKSRLLKIKSKVETTRKELDILLISWLKNLGSVSPEFKNKYDHFVAEAT